MKLRLAILAGLLLGSGASAQQPPGGGHQLVADTSNANYPAQYCQVTVTTTAAGLAALLSAASCAAIPAWATVVFVTPESVALVALRWRADGTAPSSCTASPGTASCQQGQPIFGDAQTPIQGAASIGALQLISPSGSVVTDINFGG